MDKLNYFNQAQERKESFGARDVVEQDFPGEPPNLYKSGFFVAARGKPGIADTLVKGICFYDELTIRDLAAISVMRYYSEHGVRVSAIIPDEENKIFHHSTGNFLDFLEGFVGYFAPKANILPRSRYLTQTFSRLSQVSTAIPAHKILRILKEESQNSETVTAQFKVGEYPSSQILDLLISLSDIMGPVIENPLTKVVVVAEPPKDNYVLLARESIVAATKPAFKGEELFHGLYYLYPPRLTREDGKFAKRKYLAMVLSGENQKENQEILRIVPKASDGMSLQEFQSNGAEPLSCPVFQYALYSEAVLKDLGIANISIPLESIKKACKVGNMTCQECKKCIIEEPHKQTQEFLKNTFTNKLK